ncbi:pectinesterase inhibitor 11-like [Impatiens glandulifera]|uniref:pectinesterase inhibitor 11-like n=1 Tax=Impatiens glandulifera TaxID=253017 RepID=UPI001FB0C65D|nr:pectinesterase inhibitor 11-like [Impatiens glandulifera]
MAKSILFLISLFYAGSITVVISSSTSAATTSFIQVSCRATTYPTVCVQSLAGYASTIQKSHRKLAHTALSVSLEQAQSTRAFVNKLTKFKGLKSKEIEAIQDCLEEMNDSVDRISQSVQELKTIGSSRGQSQDFFWHMSNVQTWVSAALTDDTTCMDGFSDKGFNPRIKASIKTRVTNTAQLTSNALSLINHFAAKF